MAGASRPKLKILFLNILAVALLALVPALLSSPPESSAQQTVDDLVSNPPVIKIVVTDNWRYESEFLLTSIYNSIKEKDYISADALVKKLLEQRPDDPSVLQLAVHTSMHLKQWGEAEGYLQRLVADQPDNLPLRTRLGFVRERQGKYVRAVMDFQEALSKSPSAPLKAYLDTAISQARTGYESSLNKSAEKWADIMEAGADENAGLSTPPAEIINGFLEDHPQYPEALLARAEISFADGQYQAAKKDYIAVLRNPLAEKFQGKAIEGLVKIDRLLLAGYKAENLESSPGDEDLTSLAAKLNQLLAASPNNPSLLFLRGSTLLLSGGDEIQAKADFRSALAEPGLDEAEKEYIAGLLEETEIRGSLADLEQPEAQPQPAAGPDWAKIHKTEAELRKKDDLSELENFYTELMKDFPAFSYAYSARGYLKLADQRLEPAKKDFEQAIKWETDPKIIASYEETLQQIDDRINNRSKPAGDTYAGPRTAATSGGVQSSGTSCAAPPAEHYLSQASDAFATRRWAEFSAALAKLDTLSLDSQQTGRRDYLAAQYLWEQKEYDQAFALYMRALENLPQDFLRSDSYARISSYYFMRGDNQKALEYINKSLSMTPEFSWHNIQAGNVQLALKNSERAVDYFLKAAEDQTITLPDSYYYEPLARAYRNLGDRSSFDLYMRRHIDSEVARMNLKGSNREEEIRHLHSLKKGFADMSKQYGGHFFVFGNRYKNKDYITSFSAEVRKLTTFHDFRTEIYAITGGTLGSSFSGTYFNPWANQEMRWVGKSRFGDDAYAGLGARLFPFNNSGFNIAAEHIFGIGDDRESDTRLILNTYEALGNDWEPIKSNWTYASFYGQITYSTRENYFYYGSEGRLGRRFSLECFDRLVDLTPFVGVSVDYGGENVSKGSRWGLETGPGLMISKWLDEDDPYKVPTSSIDFAVQYRFGLSHERDDLVTGTLYFSF